MYSVVETGERKPSVKTAKKIANAFGFDWTKFFEDDPAGESAQENKSPQKC
jgi:transcriptional regulator with XRE-family HTH domain